jgi:uncharacterized protein (DUF2062 family)
VNIKNWLKERLTQRPAHDPASNKAWLGEYLRRRNTNHFGRRAVAGGVGLGFFLAFIPIPIQMFLAVPAALAMKVNLAVTIAATWISNPITLVPLMVLAYSTGCFILRLDNAFIFTNFEPSIFWFHTMLANVWLPLVTGALVCGIIAGAIGYTAVLWLWRFNLLRARRERTKSRRM